MLSVNLQDSRHLFSEKAKSGVKFSMVKIGYDLMVFGLASGIQVLEGYLEVAKGQS